MVLSRSRALSDPALTTTPLALGFGSRFDRALADVFDIARRRGADFIPQLPGDRLQHGDCCRSIQRAGGFPPASIEQVREDLALSERVRTLTLRGGVQRDA